MPLFWYNRWTYANICLTASIGGLLDICGKSYIMFEELQFHGKENLSTVSGASSSPVSARRSVWEISGCFPPASSLYGGGSFLIPYFIFVALIGSTGVIGEMCLGRGTRSGPIDAPGAACETRGRRKLGDALGFILAAGSRDGDRLYRRHGLDPKICHRSLYRATLALADTDGFASAFGSMASRIWKQWLAAAALFFCILILMFGVGSGIENANKLMMPVFFILFVFLGIYGIPRVRCRVTATFSASILRSSQTQKHGFSHWGRHFSPCPSPEMNLIYGSYLSDEENIPASAARVALFITIAAILAALVIIPAMATTGKT